MPETAVVGTYDSDRFPVPLHGSSGISLGQWEAVRMLILRGRRLLELMGLRT